MTTVKLPGVGQVDQRWLIGGGALVVGIVGFAWWHRGSTAAAADTTSADQSASLDGSAEGVSDGTPWPFRPIGGSTVDPADAGSAPTTNEAWTTEAIDKMEAAGWERQLVATTIGKFLARKPLAVPTETELIQAVLAMEGPPPQGSYSIIPATPTAPDRPGGTITPPAVPFKYVVQIHQFSVPTSNRAAIQRFSDAAVHTTARSNAAGLAAIQDPHNARYMGYFFTHAGYWPAKSRVYLHVIKKK